MAIKLQPAKLARSCSTACSMARQDAHPSLLPSLQNIIPPAFTSNSAKPIKAVSPGDTMPPGFKARVGNLQTFTLPSKVKGTLSDHCLGKEMINAFQRDGILQIKMTPLQQRLYNAATKTSKAFFRRPHSEKAACVDPDSYSGYIASGEEITAGIADYSEIFTVTKDLDHSDKRVQEKWPCHGPCPYPDQKMKSDIDRYMGDLAGDGDKLLQLIELGLGVPEGSLTKYTDDGWHQLRMLRFPSRDNTNGKGKRGRGIGSHTDYGLLVIAAQDEVGGLFVLPPNKGDSYANWNTSTAGHKEDDPNWLYVPPVPGTFTVFPGDMLQYMTNSALPSTPHKVGLNTRERFAFAYFHEPNFRSVLNPLPGYDAGQEPKEGIHYGTHFTNMFLRNYPDRITTKTMEEEGRYEKLSTSELRDE